MINFQSDELDGALLGSLNGQNSQSNIDAINRRMNLTLPATPPSGLSQQQLKRRHIFAAIVHSECSYVATLQRLVNVSFENAIPSITLYDAQMCVCQSNEIDQILAECIGCQSFRTA